jgi:hypothetical protein
MTCGVTNKSAMNNCFAINNAPHLQNLSKGTLSQVLDNLKVGHRKTMGGCAGACRATDWFGVCARGRLRGRSSIELRFVDVCVARVAYARGGARVVLRNLQFKLQLDKSTK